MKGHRTDWEDGDEGAQNGLRRRQWSGPGRTEKTAVKGHRMDWEDGNEGAQTEDNTEGTQNGLGRRL